MYMLRRYSKWLYKNPPVSSLWQKKVTIYVWPKDGYVPKKTKLVWIFKSLLNVKNIYPFSFLLTLFNCQGEILYLYENNYGLLDYDFFLNALVYLNWDFLHSLNVIIFLALHLVWSNGDEPQIDVCCTYAAI